MTPSTVPGSTHSPDTARSSEGNARKRPPTGATTRRSDMASVSVPEKESSETSEVSSMRHLRGPRRTPALLGEPRDDAAGAKVGELVNALLQQPLHRFPEANRPRELGDEQLSYLPRVL